MLRRGDPVVKRKDSGRYVVTSVAGEKVRAYVPAPLPPVPPLNPDGALQQTLEAAGLALGRLDGISALLPDRTLFLYTYVRKEAVLSSQIEGTQSSLSDLLLFELEEAPGVPIDDVVDVANYVAALEHGLRRLREGFPLSNRLFREIHEILLSRGRGSDKSPGEFRRSQNWIGGARPGTAVFVPPPPNLVGKCMSDLEKFLHSDAHRLPVLVRTGLAHVQFETIHPFLDGNGRLGRLLITFQLCQAGVLRDPFLYLSLYLKQYRSTYYDLLDEVRRTGDWEAWLAFFLEGVRQTAEGAVTTARDLTAMFASDRAKIMQTGRRAGSALRVHEALKSRPLLSLPEAREQTGLSFPAASSAMDLLVDQGIAREITGKRRGRIFAYDSYLTTMSKGTEV